MEELKSRAFDARLRYRMGAITREEAKQEISPYIKAFNDFSIKTAKKYGVKGKRISFAGFVR